MSEQEINIQTPVDTAEQQNETVPAAPRPAGPSQATASQATASQATASQATASQATASQATASQSTTSLAASLLMGVKLQIRVLLGRTQLPLRDIVQLGSGAVVELDRSPDDPVEIVVNNRVIAHGEVVVVSGNYGVRVTRIASRHEEVETEAASMDLLSLSQKLR